MNFQKQKKNNMKKLIAICAIAFSCILSNEVKAQVAPIWPSGACTIVTYTATGTTSLTISNNCVTNTVIPTLTGNLAVVIVVNSKLRAGALLHIVIKTTGTETTTFSGAIVAAVVTGVAGKTWSQSYVYSGVKFYPTGAKIQVD